LGRTFATPFLTSNRRKQTSFNLTTIFLSRRYRGQSNPTQYCDQPPSGLHQSLQTFGQEPVRNPSQQTQMPPLTAQAAGQQLSFAFVRWRIAFLAHGLAAHLDAMSVVNQTVEDAVGDGGIADLLVPARNCRSDRRDR
jgi:hypothetical protein